MRKSDGDRRKRGRVRFPIHLSRVPHQCVSHLPPVHWGRLCLRAKCSSVTPDYPPSQEQKCGSADEWINPSRTSRKLSITDIKTAMSGLGLQLSWQSACLSLALYKLGVLVPACNPTIGRSGDAAGG